MDYDSIEKLIDEGLLATALAHITENLESNPQDARMHLLHGKLMMKESRWGDAISCFLKAEAIEPDGPAREAREMLTDIMDFYNKDMYNQ